MNIHSCSRYFFTWTSRIMYGPYMIMWRRCLMYKQAQARVPIRTTWQHSLSCVRWACVTPIEHVLWAEKICCEHRAVQHIVFCGSHLQITMSLHKHPSTYYQRNVVGFVFGSAKALAAAQKLVLPLKVKKSIFSVLQKSIVNFTKRNSPFWAARS